MATQQQNQGRDPKPQAKSQTVEEIAKVTPAPEKPKLPEKLPAEARVRAVRNPAYHLLTGELIPSDADKKIKLDAFAVAQLRAGKWEIVD